jgi:NAD+ synthase (glutamine-hydrolysing)
MKIALAQLNYHVGNFESNTAKIIQSVEEARLNGADLVVFAELCISGYPARDFLELNEFITLCDESARAIAAACTDIACIIGLPIPNLKPEGKDLSNAAWLLRTARLRPW